MRSHLPYDSTPLGTFHVQARNRATMLTLADGQTYQVKYWVPFDAPLFGFHDSSWQSFPYGSPAYRTQGSHGCVHLPLAAMRLPLRLGLDRSVGDHSGVTLQPRLETRAASTRRAQLCRTRV